MVFLGKVVDISDPLGAERIKVRLKNADQKIKNDIDLPYAFPLLPKILHVKPKVGEAVIVMCINDNPMEPRFYLGPLTSQYQKLYKDGFDTGTQILNNEALFPSIDNIPDTYGAFGDDEDVTIYGRKNSDIIVGDNDIRIRSGARLTNTVTEEVNFNENNPSVIKLKYHEDPIFAEKSNWNNQTGEMQPSDAKEVKSTVNVIGQEINLISTEGDPVTNVTNTDSYNKGQETISDEDIQKFIESAHPLPYGDVLLRFLYLLLKAFKSHTHAYSQLPPVPDVTYKALEAFEMNDILSKNVRIN